LINVTIDGIPVQVEEGATILDAAEKAGIHIPTLCHLKGVTGEGSCRMCLVEVEGVRGMPAACSFPVAEGNVVHTDTPKVIESRKFVLNLLLSNHRTDCFSCAKNGDCKLQEYCYEYGIEMSKYEGEKTEAPIDDSNEFFTYDPSQCIMCRRCVNTCHKLHGVGAISVVDRGFSAAIRAPFDELLKSSDCVSCGNCVSNCPVGALAPKSKHRFRTWEVKHVPTTCSYCGVGCQLDLLVKGNKVVGVQPLDGPANHGLLCVKGKFGYEFIDHPDRLKKPLIRKDGELVETSWDEALDYVADKLKAIKAESGPDAIAGLTSARCTNEENYAFMKMMRAAVGTNNVDHCARL
jgi:predicted molibdopterin-dependent oxidoreductase YjgC